VWGDVDYQNSHVKHSSLGLLELSLTWQCLYAKVAICSQRITPDMARVDVKAMHRNDALQL